MSIFCSTRRFCWIREVHVRKKAIILGQSCCSHFITRKVYLALHIVKITRTGTSGRKSSTPSPWGPLTGEAMLLRVSSVVLDRPVECLFRSGFRSELKVFSFDIGCGGPQPKLDDEGLLRGDWAPVE